MRTTEKARIRRIKFLLSVTEIKELSDIHGKELRRAVGTDFAKSKNTMDAAYMYTIKQTRITTSSEMAKKLAVPGGGREHKEISLRVRFYRSKRSIRSYANVSLSRDGVRPALKLTLK